MDFWRCVLSSCLYCEEYKLHRFRPNWPSTSTQIVFLIEVLWSKWYCHITFLLVRYHAAMHVFGCYRFWSSNFLLFKFETITDVFVLLNLFHSDNLASI
jgi:hypothetical protein